MIQDFCHHCSIPVLSQLSSILLGLPSLRDILRITNGWTRVPAHSWEEMVRCHVVCGLCVGSSSFLSLLTSIGYISRFSEASSPSLAGRSSCSGSSSSTSGSETPYSAPHMSLSVSITYPSELLSLISWSITVNMPLVDWERVFWCLSYQSCLSLFNLFLPSCPHVL